MAAVISPGMRPFQLLWIDGPLPGLNELIDSAKRPFGHGRRRRDGYSELKRRWTRTVVEAARAAQLRSLPRVWIRFVWRERTRRRDPDNVAAGGRKVILDGLVAAGVLPGDGWAVIEGWEDVFESSGAAPGALVELYAPAASETSHG